jgi:hypothetical protein
MTGPNRQISRRQLLVLAGLGGLSLRTLALGSAPHQGPEHAPSHAHLKQFVAKIRTPKSDLTNIIDRRERVRSRIQSRLRKDKLSVARSPNAGSYAKGTGLRRYMHGKTQIGGSDIDIPIILTASSGDKLELKALMDMFEGIVRKSYPRSKVTRTKSSIKLEFSSFKYPFDIVPMVAARGDRKLEYLFRADGTKVATSVSEHVQFSKLRTSRSTGTPGIVRFNDMVRLFKWWRELRAANDDLVTGVPTFLLELLCAKAFDQHGVAMSYTQSLQTWFDEITQFVTARRDVRFDSSRGVTTDRNWVVLDPVNSANNIVPPTWTAHHIDRLAQWFADGSATIRRVQEHDAANDGKGALLELQSLFGPAIGNISLLDEPAIAV